MIEAEYEELFRKNHSRLFYCALDIVEDAEVAKDIVHDTFCHLWEHRDQFLNRNQQLDSYLYRMVRNNSISYMRHQAVVNGYARQQLAIKEEIMGASSGAEEHEERLLMIEQVMGNFTPKTSDVFRLCYMEGKKYQEVAALLDMSLSAVKKHMNKAFAAFRAAARIQKE